MSAMSASREIRSRPPGPKIMGLVILLTALSTGTVAAEPYEFSESRPTPTDTLQASATFMDVFGGAAAHGLLGAGSGLAFGAGLGSVLSDGGEWSGLGIAIAGCLGAVVGGTIGSGVGAHRANHGRGSSLLISMTVLATGAGMIAWADSRDDITPILYLIPATILTATIAEVVSTPSQPSVELGLWSTREGASGPALSLRF